MRLGMVVDTDHMSELSATGAWDIAGKTVPGKIYPIVAAHNGARKLAPRPLDKDTNQPARPGARRGKHGWPTEAMKSETQLDRIKASKGIFGLGIAGGDSQSFGAVANDCPGSSKTFAQGFQYLLSRVELPVALGTDWNALLAGPGPRFGPRAASGLEAEVGEGDQAWGDSVRAERLGDALAQQAGVLYDTPIRDWRTYRFADSKLFESSTLVDRGQLLWQALALKESGTDLSLPSVAAALTPAAAAEAPALDLAMGLTGMPASRGSDYHRAGTVFAAIAAGETIDLAAETIEVQQIVDGLGIVDALWTAMRTGTAPRYTGTPSAPCATSTTTSTGWPTTGSCPTCSRT